MIVGTFRDGTPRVTLAVSGSRGTREIEFVVDTAFTGALSLPPGILQKIGAIPDNRVRCRLASGVEEFAAAATVSVGWLRGDLSSEAIIYENNPLIGTALFDDCLLTVEATEGGEVVIEAL